MKILFALTATVISCVVQASPLNVPTPSTSKVAKLHKLLDSFHIADTILQERSICVQETITGVYSPERVAKDKGDFRGFKPGTPEWPKVLKAYSVYAEQSCSVYEFERMEPYYIQFYDSRLSDDDIDAYLAFQKTPAAEHMAAAIHDATAYFSSVFKDVNEPVVKSAGDQLTASLVSLCNDEPLYERLFCHP